VNSHSAVVYQLKDRLLVHPWQQTTEGLGIASEPYIRLPLDADAEALGNAVLTALAASGRTVPHPSSWKGLEEPRHEAAGVRSEKAFQTGTRSVSVEREGEALRLEPSRNGASKGNAKGFHPLPDLATSVPASATAAVIGQAVRASLEKCR
jgi:hypothetical protein